MHDMIFILQQAINNKINIDTAIGKVENFINETGEKSEFLPVLRALNAFRDENKMDFYSNIRQCILYFKTSLEISEHLYQGMLEYQNLFGFVFSNYDGYKLNITSKILPNDKDLSSQYEFLKVRKSIPSVSDGRLFKYYGYKSYTSLAQKTLLYMISNMQKYETLMACLPTGAGKSLTWQLPAVSKMYKGLIIVVVPTVALAIDHERSSRKIFEKFYQGEQYPAAYYSNIDEAKKKEIFNSIEEGTLPILYISPEALLSRYFKTKIVEAAENGKVSAMYIDEAHLIVNWGVRFRPEFQMLSYFRNILKNKCKDGFKTILLSATYTEDDADIIKKIFNDENFTEFRADELRYEPSYYYKKCNTEADRLRLVNELVAQAPKPLIVYVVSPSEGEKYYNSISNLGFKNLALFTGETSNEDRKKIIDDWNNNKIDIIVATSAFGMGVDKGDVRTVITAYMPENISRFYQEVGRAGRDGFSSLNYFLYCDKIDNDYVSSLTRGAVLTVENLVSRWSELLKHAERQEKVGDEVWINLNVPPEHLKYEIVGQRNASWNKDVIMFFLRIGLINIVDLESSDNTSYRVLTHLNDIELLEDNELLEEYIQDFRQQERERITDGVEAVKELIKAPKNGCYSKYFQNEFPYVPQVCNGCPYCRKNNLGKFYNPGDIIIKSNRQKFERSANLNSSELFDLLLLSSESLMISVDTVVTQDLIENALLFLIEKNINIIIVPEGFDANSVIEDLSFYYSYNYLLLTLEEALKIDVKWLYGICCGFYTEDEVYNQRLYDFITEYSKSNINNKVIHIAKSNLFIKSESRKLSELIDQNINQNQCFGG